MSNKKFEFLNKIDDIPSGAYIVLGVIFLALHITVCKYTSISPTGFGLLCILLYALSAGAIWVFSRRRIAMYKAEAAEADKQNKKVIEAFKEQVYLPYAIITENGRIAAVNAAMRSVTGERGSYFNLEISEILNLDAETLINAASADDADGENKKALTTTIEGKRFEVFTHVEETKPPPAI